MDCKMPDLPFHYQLLEITQIHVHWVGDAIQPSHPLSSPSPPPANFSSISAFASESILRISWPKYWSFSFNISPSNEYSALTSFSMDSLDLLAVQETLRVYPTPPFKGINFSARSFVYSPTLTSIHDTTGKTIALTRWILVGKVMSLLFNILFRLVIAFLPRSKHLLISWL